MARDTGLGMAAAAAGALFIYAGAKGYSLPAAAQNIIQGKPPSAGQASSPLYSGGGQPAGTPGTGGPPPGPVGASGNVALGQAMAAQRGWTGQQWDALYQLWQRESGWQTTATNPSSGAYGIPQSLPASKMASAGADWKTNPATQIKWGLSYIAGRYGTPLAAWQHEESAGWY